MSDCLMRGSTGIKTPIRGRPTLSLQEYTLAN